VQDASDFDRVLIEAWEDRFAGGLFRYDVTAVLTRLIEGPSRYVAQYNEGRATKKRQTEFKMDLVCQEFDGKKFNFTKADQKEVLFTFEEQDEHKEENDDDDDDEPGRTEFIERGEISKSPNLVLINVSPIEYGHVLLCPRVSEMLPQQIFAEALIPPLRMCAESKNPYFRVGYNSLGAYATINHLHFQAYYLMEAFPIERALSKPFAKDVFKNPKRPMGKQVHAECLRVYDYPVRCIVFELGSKGFVDLAKWIGRACGRLQRRNIPFNLLMTDHGARVFLIPQIFSHKIAQNKIPDWIVETGINPAVFEISGHMLFKREEDYDICSEAMASEILASASIEEDEFCDLMREVLDRERIEEGEEEEDDDEDSERSKNKVRSSEEEGSAQMSVKV
jgi:GDP-L-galactose phosphorylase